MPTYKNETANSITAKFRLEGIDQIREVKAGETWETEMVVSDYAALGLSKTSDAPYYNPAYQQDELTSTGGGDDKTVNIHYRAKSIEIINNSATATISAFVGSASNTPPLKVPPSSTRVINNIMGRYAALILQFSEAVVAGECIVTQLK